MAMQNLSRICATVLISFQLQVVIGGLLEPDVEGIIRERARLLHSPVLSTLHPCISSSLKQYRIEYEIPVQICDIHMEITNHMVVSYLFVQNNYL